MLIGSQPYRPPDPSALPPMPFGLPFIARPGQEGFDQYGRMSMSTIFIILTQANQQSRPSFQKV
jgi:hypothetical protein